MLDRVLQRAATTRRTRPAATTVSLVNEPQLQQRAVGLVLTAARSQLADPPDVVCPCLYALFYDGTHPLYVELPALEPLYVGSGVTTGDRLRSHRASIDAVADLDVVDFTLVVVPMPTRAQAHLAEELVDGALQPLWNSPEWSGFGSRPQGRGRVACAPTAWDRLHPGRLDRNQLPD